VKELSLTQTMLMADALIEYAVKHVLDDALFSRSVEVLRAIEYATAADALQRYSDSLDDLGIHSVRV
jgi:hypothetical protein